MVRAGGGPPTPTPIKMIMKKCGSLAGLGGQSGDSSFTDHVQGRFNRPWSFHAGAWSSGFVSYFWGVG
jgi:hypothetical protein